MVDKCQNCGTPAQMSEKKMIPFLPFTKKVSNLKNFQGREICENCYSNFSKMKIPIKTKIVKA